MIIYKTTNVINGLVYIGQKNGHHNKSYIGGGVLLMNAVKEFGKKNFKHEVIIEGDFNKNLSNELEKHFIRLYAAQIRSHGYNIMSGGRALSKHSPETIKKLSESKMGNAWNKGRKPSPLNRSIVEAAARNNKITEQQREKMNEGRIKNHAHNFFANHKLRTTNKETVFLILTDRRNGMTMPKIIEKYNIKQGFLSKLLYNDKFYKDWKVEYLSTIKTKQYDTIKN